MRPTTDELYVGEHFSNAGRGKHNEDRAGIGKVQTASGLKLFVAIVCDGVGGRNKGEVASRTAMESFIQFLRQSNQASVPQAVQEAAIRTNQVVRDKGDEITCTLVAAIIHKDNTPWGRLYIANLGDSRVVLVRDKKLHWLNREHNIRTDRIFSGMPAQEAFQLENGHYITRAIGAKPDADVDMGFYHDISHITPPPNGEARARMMGMQGMELREGDTIFCCSDGIPEINPEDNKPYLHEDEILRYALHSDVANAVRTLQGYAESREPRDDNTLAMVFVAPNSKMRRATVETNRRAIFMVAGILSTLVMLLLVAFLFTSQDAQENAGQLTFVAQEATLDAQYNDDLTRTAMAYTPTPSPTSTPSPTPFPTLQVGQWGTRYENRAGGNSSLMMENNANIDAVQPEKIDIAFPDGILDPASFYVQPNSAINFVAVSSSIRLKFLRGDIFIHTGQYSSVITELEFAPGIEFSITGSCMAVHLDNQNRISVWCFEGSCAYNNSFGQSTPINTGTQSVWAFDTTTRQLTPMGVGAITPADAVRYRDILGQTGDGLADANQCLVSFLPTPTPTSTNTRVPTRVPLITPTSGIIILPSNTPVPPVQQNNPPPVVIPPTNTPVPRTNTPLAPTATPEVIPPTATPEVIPPTATSEVIPPTATSEVIPPTATPEVIPPVPTPEVTPQT